jgi:hypothetical protein
MPGRRMKNPCLWRWWDDQYHVLPLGEHSHFMGLREGLGGGRQGLVAQAFQPVGTPGSTGFQSVGPPSLETPAGKKIKPELK